MLMTQTLFLCNIEKIFLYISVIEMPSEVIWSHLTCTSFIILRLNIQQVLLAQHISLLNYTLLPFHLQLPGGSAAPFFSGVAIPFTDSRLLSFLATF